MSEQERLKASQIQYAQEDALDALRAENVRLRRGLENCHMLARRIVASESAFFKIDSANHIIRMCEEAGVTSVKGVLRDAALQPERGLEMAKIAAGAHDPTAADAVFTEVCVAVAENITAANDQQKGA